MKPTKRSTFTVLSIGLLALGFSACVPQYDLARNWRDSSPRINEGWQGKNGKLQWHPQTGKQVLSQLGTQRFFDGDGIDSDGDGIFDNRDECANTPKGVNVYWQAEHFSRNEIPIGRPGCPVDRDLDGIPDYLDSCPFSAHGAIIDASGCDTDSDRDGVKNDKDKCPTTPYGAKVDKVGCWVLSNLHFSTNSSKVSHKDHGKLQEVAGVLKQNSGAKVDIQGHTDSVGTAASNLTLSNNRASAVRDYLISQGIDGSRLTSQGFGLTKPVASNATEGGRAQNRRVELKTVR